MPNKKTRSLSLLFLGLALFAVAPRGAFAFGPKAPASSEIANKADFLDTAIREFNAKYVDIKFGPNHANTSCYYNTNHTNNHDELLSQATNELCNRISPLFENGMTCGDFIAVNDTKTQWSDETTRHTFMSDECTSTGTSKFTAALTPKAQQLMQSAFFYDNANSAVDYNVRSIQSALNNLQLLPRQRKALDGFFNATDAFVNAINIEKVKANKGEKALPLTHRSFASQASLLAAYYRYLKDDFAELAQFGSASAGISKINQQSVNVINNSIQHLTDAYGLDTDVAAKQVADYGRVLLDLLNNFALTLTTSEKAVVQPVMVQLVTQVVPTSEAYGDVGAHEAVIRLKDLWESVEFSGLLTDKLSISDDKSTALILNMSAAAYKLGLSGNVDIRTFDARDAERIKNQKGRK